MAWGWSESWKHLSVARSSYPHPTAVGFFGMPSAVVARVLQLPEAAKDQNQEKERRASRSINGWPPVPPQTPA